MGCGSRRAFRDSPRMSRRRPTEGETQLSIGQLHAGQIAAYRALRGHRIYGAPLWTTLREDRARQRLDL